MHASSPRRALFSPSDTASRVISRTAAIACLALTLAACGGGGGGGANFSGTPVGSVTTTPTTGTGTSTGGSTTAPPTPVYSIGNGSGSGFKDGLVDTNKTTLESGDTATLRVNVVDQATNPPATDLSVSFASTCSSSGLATFGTVSQVTRGLFSVSYTNSGCDRAEDVVTATLTTNGRQASTKIRMVGPDVLSVSFVSATSTQLALAGIGGNESSELIFKVAGPQGVPVVGKSVDFSLNTSVGGASILAGRTSATTDQAGQVRTVVNSGTIAGPVNVRAVERGTGKQGISPDIVISTGVPNANRFSLSYAPQNLGRAFNTDGIETTLNIIASDIFGNNPTDGTRVTFVSPESGNVQNSCQLQNGACSVTWRSSGSRPLNMRATVLAYTSGAENFTDKNGNSVYDLADGAMLASDDMSEPYADENENGRYDIGEYFFDTNKNAVRDIGNGKWDGPCLSKVDSRAVCAGESTVAIYGSAVVVMSDSTPRIKTLGSFPSVGSPITMSQGSSVAFSGMYLTDGNTFADSLGGNPLPLDTTITFSIDGGGASTRGVSTYTIPNTTRPEGSLPLGISVAAAIVAPTATLPANVTLLMRVAAPGLTTDYQWPIIITR